MLVFERRQGMASLLRLYQQDAEARDPALAHTTQDPILWLQAAKEYLTRLRERFDHTDDVPVRHKRIAADAIDLALQSLQANDATRSDPATPGAVHEVAGHQPGLRPFVTMLLLMFVLLLVNLWIMSVIGVASLSGLIAAFVLLHWEEVGLIERRLRSKRSRSSSAQRPAMAASATASAQLPTVAAKSRTISVGAYIEPVVRRIDAMIERDARPDAPLPSPPSLKPETLAFFQDILEAKLADDKDFAFKKISRTVEQVLSSEDIAVITDVQNHPAMFTIDTITDAGKTGMMEAVRPALVRHSQCIMTGYAHRFVNA